MTKHGFKLERLPKDKVLTINDNQLNEMFKKPDGTLNPLGQFVFYSKYSRWREDVKRREYWAETTQRSTEYNTNLAIGHLMANDMLTDEQVKFHQEDLDKLSNNQFHLRQALSGRTLWTGGTTPSYENPMSNFNCSFMVINEWCKLGELIHLGMVGSGIGFRILRTDVSQLKPISIKSWEINHQEYKPRKPEERQENTLAHRNGREVVITIGDSKEGWRQAIDALFKVLTGPMATEIISFNYDSIRQAGEALKTFGGRAGGPDTIKGMFDTFHRILNGKLTEGYPKVAFDGTVTPLHVLDLANAIGKNIVSGDVRSIAEIALLDPKDDDTISAKDDVFGNESLYHRFVSNNSIFYNERPTQERLNWQFDKIRYNGEPCFFNAVVAQERRPNADGTNPCVEIILADRGLCNLTTVNVLAFVVEGKFDYYGLHEAFRLATRAGLRMTLPRLELDEWDLTQQRDRLLGVSMTGYQDAIDAIGRGDDFKFQKSLLRRLRKTVRDEADRYALQLGVNAPLLTTCVKPEGTQSLLFGGVSSGLHVSHAPHYLRRIRSSSKDPISKAVFDLGWKISAEYADGSQKREIEYVAQFISEIKQPSEDPNSIDPITYEYHKGILTVKTRVGIKDHSTDLKAQIEQKLSTWYDQEISAVVEVEGDTATIEYKVDFSDHKDGFSAVFGHTQKIVVEFPVSTGAKRHRDNWGAIKQLETYKMFLNNFTEHNPSNTISVRDEEWDEVKQWVYDNWDSTLAMSFLSHADIVYPLLPYETTDEATVNELKESMQPFDANVLMKYDNGNDMEVIESDCIGGACPVR